jgi:hypothetical protein
LAILHPALDSYFELLETMRQPDSQRLIARPSGTTLRGLDWLNFFLADVQTGVGPFLAIYLASFGWNEQQVGLALTVGGIAGIVTQTPAGSWESLGTNYSTAGRGEIKPSIPPAMSRPHF